MSPGPCKQFDPERALEEAMAVFARRGFEGASLAELTEAMGIGKKSLYDTFGNKRALFLQSVRHYSQRSVAQIRSRLFKPGSRSIYQNLRELLDEWRDSHGKPGSQGCLLGTTIADFDTSDREVAEALRLGLKQIEDAFTEALDQARRDGEIRPDASTRDLARALLCISQGVALLGRVMETGEVLDSALEVTAAQVLRGQ